MTIMMLMAFASCAKTEYYYVDDSLKEWFVDKDKADFQVLDQNGIIQNFHIDDALVDLIPSEAYFFFMKTDGSIYENIDQSGQVTYYQGNTLGLSISNYYDRNTYFALYFYDLRFVVDVDQEPFTCSECDDQIGQHLVPCTFEILDSHEVNGVTYEDVMHIKITDSSALSTRTTFPSELYYAKHYGPVEYELGGKVRFFRQ